MTCATTAYASYEVPIDQDWEFGFDLVHNATTTGLPEAATGISMTGYFSLTEGGAVIAGTNTTLTERSATAGRYYGSLVSSALTTALADYVGEGVWEVYTAGGNPVASIRVLVTASRTIRAG